MVIKVQAPFPHWLACVKHSVSVHPEPGSNSSFNIYFHLLKSYWQELFIIKSPYLSHLLWYMLLLFICLLYMIHFRIDKRYYIKNKKDCQLLFLFFFSFFEFYIFYKNNNDIMTIFTMFFNMLQVLHLTVWYTYEKNLKKMEKSSWQRGGDMIIYILSIRKSIAGQ